METIFILGGDCRQVDDWLGKHFAGNKKDRRIINLHSSQQLRGYTNPILFRVGTWYERHNIEDIMDVFRSRLMNVSTGKHEGGAEK